VAGRTPFGAPAAPSAQAAQIDLDTDKLDAAIGVKVDVSVAADVVGMHPQTLRMYEAKGLVHPGRTPGGTRLYSENDLERLRLIQRLTTELGLNLAGVEQVLRMQDELNRTRARMQRLERELRAEIAEVHRSYRRDVVLYRPAQHPAPRS